MSSPEKQKQTPCDGGSSDEELDKEPENIVTKPSTILNAWNQCLQPVCFSNNKDFAQPYTCSYLYLKILIQHSSPSVFPPQQNRYLWKAEFKTWSPSTTISIQCVRPNHCAACKNMVSELRSSKMCSDLEWNTEYWQHTTSHGNQNQIKCQKQSDTSFWLSL